LGAENLTLKEIFTKLGAIAERKPPSVEIPYAVAYAAGMVSTGIAYVTGKEPRAPLDGVRMAKKAMWVRHDKAARELGYNPGPAPGALRQAVDWFKANGYC
jgi:dihydroflavonol-4-reductase